MKDLTDEELINNAYIEVKKIDIHCWTQIVISLLMVIESAFLIFQIINVWTFTFFWVLFLCFYLIHRNKSKKSEIKLQNIIDELTSRNQ